MEKSNTCPECGAKVENGTVGCQSLFDELALAAYKNIRRLTVHNLAFDSYCMQHPTRYCKSAKSYAAH